MSATPRLPASDRRRQLLETALNFFSRKGFEGTTTKEIAAAAGVTEAIIFRHFPTKQALYTAVIDFHHEAGEYDEWLAQLKTFMDRNDDEGLIRSIIECIVTKYRTDARVQRVLMFAALEGHELGLEHNRRRSYPIFELLTQYVARRQSEGALLGSTPEAIIAAASGMAVHYGMMTELFGFKADVTDQQVADSFTRIVMDGVRGTNQSQRKSQ